MITVFLNIECKIEYIGDRSLVSEDYCPNYSKYKCFVNLHIDDLDETMIHRKRTLNSKHNYLNFNCTIHNIVHITFCGKHEFQRRGIMLESKDFTVFIKYSAMNVAA